MSVIPSFKEDHISQIPALQLLINMEWEYLTQKEVFEERAGSQSRVLLESILKKQLQKINRIQHKSNEYPFSEANILAAIDALKEIPYDGLIRTNEKAYDLITLGKSFQQSINGDLKSHTLRYIDWDDIENNTFHISEEYPVERSGSHETRRPDIVLFVNGIPIVIIECKSPNIKEPLKEAISQQIRNQKDEQIPKLFIYSQLLMVLSKNEAKYATTGTPESFWAVWKEENLNEEELEALINRSLPEDQKKRLFNDRYKYVEKYFDSVEKEGRKITLQDRMIFSLLRHERLFELIYRFILFDNNEKKIARYKQYFAVKKIMRKILSFNVEGIREGGVVWHTQGSGKSLTMVMLAKAIAMEKSILDYKIILVTDRVELDRQIYKTFGTCGKNPERAITGNHLIELLQDDKSRIIATTIFKFEAAVSKKIEPIKDSNIFVLVDESHRTNYGVLHAKMKKVLQKACFIGFTGTPLMKKEKNTIAKFGSLIDSYTINEAVVDNSVVPLLYEGRYVPQDVQQDFIDNWFEKITQNLSKEQKIDLKKKYSKADQLNRAEQKIRMIAWDIGAHFIKNFTPPLEKAQLVADRRSTAIKYKEFLDEFGYVTSEVLISPPDEREGETDIYEDNKEIVNRFWKKMMTKYRNETEYNESIISKFKHDDHPQIIIVVEKLITGFDAPRNTVLYLTKNMKEHTLLQTIARVNRLNEGKDFGYIIDYYGILAKLHEAMELYAEFERRDLELALIDISKEVEKLPQKHSNLWELFKDINKNDEEQYEISLRNQKNRDVFYEKLKEYVKTMRIAMSSEKFLTDTPENKIKKYNKDLLFFMNLRSSIRRRYAEEIDFKEYEPKIQKLLDDHVTAGEVETITPLVNIFDKENFEKEVAKLNNNFSAQADMIAHRALKTIHEKMIEDPAFYKKFSRMIKDTIEDYYAKRISDLEYLNKIKMLKGKIVNHEDEERPKELSDKKEAYAFFGIVRDKFIEFQVQPDGKGEVLVNIGLKIDEIIRNLQIVNWENNVDVQNKMRNEIEEYFYEVEKEYQFKLNFIEIDIIMEECLDTARVLYAS